MSRRLSKAAIVRGCAAALLLAGAVQADWNPGEPEKWTQLPDLNPATAMDVNATFNTNGMPFMKVLADDFECRYTCPITDIHIWGSWLNDQMNPNTTFKLSIHSDVPAGADATYSHPGPQLWSQLFAPPQYTSRLYAPMMPMEPFYDPNTGLYLGIDTFVWQYNFSIDPLDAFVQTGTDLEPKVYWLDVQAIVPGSEVFGWHTSLDHWNDDAVFADTADPGGPPIGPVPPPVYWQEMRYPVGHPLEGQSIDLAFVIVPEPGIAGLLAVSGLAVWIRRRRRHWQGGR